MDWLLHPSRPQRPPRTRATRADLPRAASLLLAPLALLALIGVEDALAKAQALRRDLQQLVLLDELQALLEREDARRCQDHVVVLPGRAHVRELLRAAHVEREIALL